ncbi:MAG: hypothetical protein J2P30_14745 [Actinobacteria bacterium]|nr:hypothetical protein [Actinomycetota bacterium]
MTGAPDVPVRMGTPDARRYLQLALAGLWLLDAVLQCQAFMFTKGFAGMLAGAAAGNPGWAAAPVLWAAHLTGRDPALANTGFAAVQLLIALAIAGRSTVKAGLAASIAWALAVWWLGEGLGGVLAGSASPVTGAPGAAALYALLAVLLWPGGRARHQEPAFVAAGSAGVLTTRLAWLALWGSLACITLAQASPGGLGRTLAAVGSGQRGWISAMDQAAAGLLAQRGAAVAAVLAVVLLVIAVGVFLPGRVARAVLVLAVAVAALIWVAGENFGGVFTGSGTDPNSGPLLALLAAAYWPLGVGLRRAGNARTSGGRAGGAQEPVGKRAAGERPVREKVAP